MTPARRLQVLVGQVCSAGSARQRRSLTQEELRQFHEDGFVVVHGLFDPAELQPVKKAIDRWVSAVAKTLVGKGLLSSDYSELPFEKRLTAIDREVPGIAGLMHGDKANYMDWPEMKALWGDPRLLDLCEQVMGCPEVAFHPNINVRLKVPSAGTKVDYHTVPWHQDVAYLMAKAATTLQVTAWLPLMNVNEANGCLQYVRGGHRAAPGVMKHRYCNDGTWYLALDEEEWDTYLKDKEVVTLEIPEGSFILFNNTVPHRSLPNTTEETVRWSLDIRWQDPRLPAGMGPGKLMHLRSAEPGFSAQWVPTVDREMYRVRWGVNEGLRDLTGVVRKTRGVLKEAREVLRSGAA